MEKGPRNPWQHVVRPAVQLVGAVKDEPDVRQTGNGQSHGVHHRDPIARPGGRVLEQFATAHGDVEQNGCVCGCCLANSSACTSSTLRQVPSLRLQNIAERIGVIVNVTVQHEPMCKLMRIVPKDFLPGNNVG